MAPWFNPETPKLVGPWRRYHRGSGRNRSYAVIIMVVVLIVLYFIGCSGAGVRTLMEMR